MNVDQLLKAVTHLSPAELHEFQGRLAAWQAKNGNHTQDEARLLQAAKAHLPPVQKRRLGQLIAKSERGTLSARERADYQALAQQAEQLDAARMEAVAELARRRGQPLPVVLAELGQEGREDGT